MNDMTENGTSTEKSVRPKIMTFKKGQVWQFHPDLRLIIEKVEPESSMLVMRIDRAGTVSGTLRYPFGLMTSDVLHYNAWLVNPD